MLSGRRPSIVHCGHPIAEVGEARVPAHKFAALAALEAFSCDLVSALAEQCCSTLPRTCTGPRLSARRATFRNSTLCVDQNSLELLRRGCSSIL